MGNIVSLSDRRYRKAEASLVGKLVNFASLPKYEEDFNRAGEIFWSSHSPSAINYHDALMARFHDWFLFDYTLSNGRRLVETFADENRESLDIYESVLIDYWRNSYFGLFEVVSISDNCSELRCVLDGECFLVADEALMGVSGGSLVAARPLRVDDNGVSNLSGAVVLISATYSEEIINDIKGKYQRLSRLSADLTSPAFFRICGHLLDAQLDRPSADRLVDNCGELEYHHIRQVKFFTALEVESLLSLYLNNVKADEETSRSILAMWERFRVLDGRVSVRSAGPWAAAILYTASRLGLISPFRQKDLADQFYVSKTRVSSLFRRIKTVLGLRDISGDGGKCLY